jgi:hypothetical protein
MNAKRIFRITILAGFLAAVLLTIQVISSAYSPATDADDAPEARPANYYTNSDYFERHQPAARPDNYYANSDYFERHRPAAQPDNYYANSDYFERHRPAAQPDNYYTNSDYFERHPDSQIP